MSVAINGQLADILEAVARREEKLRAYRHQSVSGAQAVRLTPVLTPKRARFMAANRGQRGVRRGCRGHDRWTEGY